MAMPGPGRRCQSGIKGIEGEDVLQVGEEQHSCCVKLIFRGEAAGRCKLLDFDTELRFRRGSIQSR